MRIKKVTDLIVKITISVFLTNIGVSQACKESEIPDATWVDIYYETINEALEYLEVRPLAEKTINDDEMEIRIWSGFGIVQPSLLVVTRASDSSWAAYKFSDIYDHLDESHIPARISLSPVYGWEDLWSKLTKEQLLELPDSSELKDDGVNMRDGIAYVVEIASKGFYRTYMYENPFRRQWPEAKRMMNIIKILNEELKRED